MANIRKNERPKKQQQLNRMKRKENYRKKKTTTTSFCITVDNLIEKSWVRPQAKHIKVHS